MNIHSSMANDFILDKGVNEKILKILLLNNLDLTDFCNSQVTIGISYLDISEGILESTFLDRRILGRLMISIFLFVKR